MDRSESVERFACAASFAQARAFVAACAERAVGVFFWSVARSTGEAAPEVWLHALELLWEPGPVDDERLSEVYEALRELLEEGFDVPFAAEAGDLVHSGLGVLLHGDPQGALQISLAARAFADELGLAAEEDEAQNGDVLSLASWGEVAVPATLSALRSKAAEAGRVYMAAAVARSGAGADAPRLRVTAVLDRSAVVAKWVHAVPRYGVVVRIVAGPGVGRYVRVDRLGDEEEGADGVMIRVADDAVMEAGCVAEWVEDWAGVEESFARDGRRVDWS